MKKAFKRWYEKDEYLKAFMALLEELSLDEQCEIAVDIIIEATSLIERDYENVIRDVAKYDPKEYKRWYDKNPNLHVAIEALHDLGEADREKIIKNFTDKILTLHNFKLEGLDE